MRYFTAHIVSYSDYYPFGMLMPNRHGSQVSPSEDYAFGYQGSEKDGEVHGESYTTHFRQLDTRIGRWLSRDPLAEKFPWQSPYVSMDNNPIWFNDVMGDSVPTTFYDESGNQTNVIPDKVSEFFASEYQIEVGYANGKLFQKGSIMGPPEQLISQDAVKAWTSVLGQTNTDESLVFGHNIELQDGSQKMDLQTGVYIPSKKTAYIDLGDYDNDGNVNGITNPIYPGETEPIPLRTFNIARLTEHEFLGHAINKFEDTDNPSKPGKTVSLVNTYRAQMGLPLRRVYDVHSQTFNLGGLRIPTGKIIMDFANGEGWSSPIKGQLIFTVPKPQTPNILTL